jgi:hypothetical protein
MDRLYPRNNKQKHLAISLLLSSLAIAISFYGSTLLDHESLSFTTRQLQGRATRQVEEKNIPSKPLDDYQTQREQDLVTEEQLNIVTFYADDWTSKVLGKLNNLVKTPNIDQMADNGMIFTQNCVTTSVCWISRATFMTGVYAARHRQTEPVSFQQYYPYSMFYFG